MIRKEKHSYSTEPDTRPLSFDEVLEAKKLYKIEKLKISIIAIRMGRSQKVIRQALVMAGVLK